LKSQSQTDSIANDSLQYDLIDFGLKLFRKKGPREEVKQTGKVRFSLTPVSNNSTGRVSISAVNFAFYLAEPKETNLSTIFFYPYINFGGRYSFLVNTNLWSYRNIYNMVADFRISSIQLEDHGLGSGTNEDNFALLSYKTIRSHITLNRLLARFLYGGLGYYLDYYEQIENQNQGDYVSDFFSYPHGTDTKHVSSGVVFNLLRDNRKNSINPDNGFYTNLAWQFYHPALGSTYRWDALLADARKYLRLSSQKRHILAIRALYWGTFGESPYTDLPATFTDRESRMGRSYYYARFRGPQLLYSEMEYRFDLSRNGFLGGVIFANLQSYTQTQHGPFVYADPGIGFGLRLKFNKQSNTNLTIDFGFGANGSFNWHLNLGEFF